MTKKLFFLLFSLIFICYQCPIKDGEIVEIPCKVVDMQDNPLKGVTLSLVSSDSFDLPLSPRVEQQKTTDSKGELTFIYEHSRLLYRFVRGENQGNLAAIELFNAPRYANDTAIKPIFRYDSLVPVKIQFTSAVPLMKNGGVSIYVNGRYNPNARFLNANFPISANRIDTLFKANVFSQPYFKINSYLTVRDTLKQRDSTIWKSISVGNGGKRDSIFKFVY
jgi:hypothetical protein